MTPYFDLLLIGMLFGACSVVCNLAAWLLWRGLRAGKKKGGYKAVNEDRKSLLDKSMKDLNINSEQLEWFITQAIEFIAQGGGTFRTFQEMLGTDYSTAYCAGGMDFTNLVHDLLKSTGQEAFVKRHEEMKRSFLKAQS